MAFGHKSDESHRTRPTIRSVPTTSGSSNRVVFGLAGSLVLSALYDSVPNQRFEAEFEHLRLPRWFRPLLVLAKTSAVTGLLIGLRSSRLGRLTAHALVAYSCLPSEHTSASKMSRLAMCQPWRCWFGPCWRLGRSSMRQPLRPDGTRFGLAPFAGLGCHPGTPSGQSSDR